MVEFAEPPIDAVIVEAFDNMRAYYSDDETLSVHLAMVLHQ